MFDRSFPCLRSAAMAFRGSAGAAALYASATSFWASGAPSLPNALVEARRHHTKATPPLHLLRRHNEKASMTAGNGGLADAAAIAKGVPTTTCSCGCHHPTQTTLTMPSMSFSTTPSRLPHRRHQLGAPAEKVESEVASFVGGRLVQSLQREQPPRGSGIQPLLDYNKQWASEISRLNPEYFTELAKQQTPQYLWIGCSDSRVPANEIVGLYPGDVFVHRNIANIVCNSDLNALAVLQYAIDCLKVEHVIVSGHYKCGGVTAALKDTRVGLADHWILHVSAVKKRHWKRLVADVPERNHLDALCELNVLAQVEHIVETHLVQRVWTRQNAEDAAAKREGRPTNNRPEDEVDIHGWVYGLADGLVRPLLTLNRRSIIERELQDATNALFWRYGQI
ncbi:putative carbonic anhydrase family protein [Leptomonas pyrrhocoris]|uniref:carbonic anhydrase n=1 Tax=Leptomonas pyrrhocoris TaxID=157538 RepID=A0A0N0DY27_LEPPY|nr:putative carbonic anhydrase family protein [Leptomonas pyrrhocoris]XP_015662104.1 putative carbonic anhydrase family protein [Leptomonas pyrrhocoris]KPA83664.1 putative carbonic anhydrase family protein [Leptomonas pyrrhocoris]KPA83665.1 putative carbonic anhydrase family protein [Leptomonas pyrrhocoris]|eukprot:XP_015662103.1 putative carbonic anhydrase family protein [Leptomonas pyrrhocoris]